MGGSDDCGRTSSYAKYVVEPHGSPPSVVFCCIVLLNYQNDAMAPRYGGGGEGEFLRGWFAH